MRVQYISAVVVAAGVAAMGVRVGLSGSGLGCRVTWWAGSREALGAGLARTRHRPVEPGSSAAGDAPTLARRRQGLFGPDQSSSSDLPSADAAGLPLVRHRAVVRGCWRPFSDRRRTAPMGTSLGAGGSTAHSYRTSLAIDVPARPCRAVKVWRHESHGCGPPGRVLTARGAQHQCAQRSVPCGGV